MPDIFERIRISKILTFSINEGVFVKSKDRFGMVSGRNKKSMIVRSWKASVPFVSFLSVVDRTRTSVIEPGLLALGREKVRGMYASIPETITSVMRWAHTEGSLIWQQ